jgi:hypothetical protein
MAIGVLPIRGGDIEVELLPALGARLHRLRVFGIDLLRTPDDIETHRRDPFFWGGYVMAPWCNRIEAAPTGVAGKEVRLAPNFPDGSAIHGQVFLAPWSRSADGRFVARGGGGGWPWPYEVELGVATADTRLNMDIALTNLADAPMPAGVGLHPWFLRSLEVRVAAPTVVASNTDPSATIGAVAGDLDLRVLRPIPDGIDAAWPDPADPPAGVDDHGWHPRGPARAPWWLKLEQTCQVFEGRGRVIRPLHICRRMGLTSHFWSGQPVGKPIGPRRSGRRRSV